MPDTTYKLDFSCFRVFVVALFRERGVQTSYFFTGSSGGPPTRRNASNITATTIEDAPTKTSTGGNRKPAIITYAAAESIAYLVKNFTSRSSAFKRPLSPPAVTA